MNKTLTTLGCLLMLGAAVAPGVFAHRDAGVSPIPYTSTHLDFFAPTGAGTGGGAVGTGQDRVAGWYFGSVSAWAELVAPTFATTGGVPAPLDGSMPPLPDLNGIPVNPGFTLAAANALCDMEVVDASGILDESTIDGTTPGGSTPDGIFNDGGIGAACHTPSGFYGVTGYDTPGCSYTPAFAEDAVSGHDVWISPSCDSTTPAATASILDHVLSLSTCAPNAVLSFDPTGIVGCANTFVSCAITGVGCPSTGATFCGADGVADDSNSGQGGVGVAFPTVALGCLNTDGAAVVFTWNRVAVDVDPLGTVDGFAGVAVYGFIA